MAKYLVRKATPGSDPEHGDPVLLDLDNPTFGDVAADTLAVGVGGLLGSNPLMHVRDEKTSGTQGGSASATTWNVRTLNTTVGTNQITGASLGSNKITLPTGVYQIMAWAPAFTVGPNKLKIYNVTDSKDEIIGQNSHAAVSGNIPSNAVLYGTLTVTGGPKDYELLHYTTGAESTNGLGLAVSAGVVEVYAEVMVRQLAA